jgi:hypothetical protein
MGKGTNPLNDLQKISAKKGFTTGQTNMLET